MNDKKNKCLQCKKTELQCTCSDGFKVLYYMGKPVTKDEADEIPKDPYAKVRRAIKEITKRQIKV